MFPARYPRRPPVRARPRSAPLAPIPPTIPVPASDIVLPYEYDEYYNTRVSRVWAVSWFPYFIGALFILLGILSIIMSGIDLGQGVVKDPKFHNPNNRRLTSAVFNVPNISSSWHENSIWPTIGKGIWYGLLLIGYAILAIVSKRDGSFIGVYIFNILSWIVMIFSMYVLLSGVMTVEAYPYMDVNGRNALQKTEIAMNALLIIFSGIAFLASLASAILSCVRMGYCSNGRVYPKYSRFVSPVS